jgi:hypothetical protein
MSISKISNAILIIIVALGFLDILVESSTANRFANNPQIPNQSSGYTHPLALKGIGTVYLTQNEWRTLLPYWRILEGLGGVALAIILVEIFRHGYTGFMREWRKP